jgi:hypothetical protein
MNRRHFIAAASASGMALVGGGLYWRVTRLPQTATLPWNIDTFPPADVRLDAFRHAILAPNPHNRQPWLIKLDGTDGALIFCDLAKRLPETDPFDRQITIGFGCFLELARIAAAERGFRLDMMLFPAGEAHPRLDKRPVARLTFVRDAATAKDPLYAAIALRRSNKEQYDLAQPVSRALAEKIAGPKGRYSVNSIQVAGMRAEILKAITIEQMTSRTYMESVRLIRVGHAQVDANPDGIDLTGPLMEGLKLAGQLDAQQLADPNSATFKSGLDSLRETYGSIPALVWIKTPTNTRTDQIEVGQRYVRANLRATAAGLSMHPMSQSLQEYAEVAGPHAAVHELLGARGNERIQMLARIGYGPAISPAPRWPLESHLV